MPKRKKAPAYKSATDESSSSEFIPAIRAAIKVADRALTRVKVRPKQAKRPKR